MTRAAAGGATVTSLLAEISATGRDALRGGYSRPGFSTPERELREWFVEQAQRRSLDVETDRNGVVWAWADAPDGIRENAVVTGSHLDSVPGGGAFDGPLGVASALVALDSIRERGIRQRRPIAIVVFPEEEGSRFGVACLGSRLMTGAIDPDRARNLTDPDGTTFAEAVATAGFDPRFLGPDDAAIARIGEFVELHVEQGRGLIDLERPVAIGSSILGHGRWRLTVLGEGNHAGTTAMTDRRDPMVAAARILVGIRAVAASVPGARATVGRLQAVPGGTNVIASRVSLWVDVRHPDDTTTGTIVADVFGAATIIADEEGCTISLTEESLSGTVEFDRGLRRRLSGILPGAPVLETGAGHDAGVLAGVVPTAMLYVRNPTGVSHSPEELIDDADAETGAAALVDVLADLSAAPAG